MIGPHYVGIHQTPPLEDNKFIPLQLSVEIERSIYFFYEQLQIADGARLWAVIFRFVDILRS